MKLEYPMKRNGMYLLKKKDFDDIAALVLSNYMPRVLEYPKPLDIESLAQDQFYLDIRYDNIEPDGKILGMMAFADTEYYSRGYSAERGAIELEEGTMLIDYSLCGNDNRARRRYTQAHELSHWICHRGYHSPTNQQYEFRRNRYVACRTENIESYRRNDFSERTENDWEEWQADSLAAALLMPKKTFVEAVETLFREYGVRRCLLPGRDNKIARDIISEVASTFDTSYRATQIRMIHLGFIAIARD